MKIAIEAQRIFRPNKHGMDFVALETIRELQKMDHENEYYILVAPGSDYCLEETPNFHIVEIKCPTYPLWEQVALPATVRKIKPDLLHCTSNTAPLWGKVPLVLTLHDVIFLEKKRGKNRSLYQTMGWYYRRFIVPRIVRKCRKIITVSDYECQRIKEALPAVAERVITIYNGYSPCFRPLSEKEPQWRKYYSGHKSYLFFLGNTDPKKNLIGTLKAYERYVSTTKDPLYLLIADLTEKKILSILDKEDMMHLYPWLIPVGYVRHTDLPGVYCGATAFLYTSLRESFGIPILEAMACGTPVITSNTSAMPEIAGPGALTVDPTDTDTIAHLLKRLHYDHTFRKIQSEYGLERVKNFSWQKTAEKLLEVYTHLLN